MTLRNFAFATVLACVQLAGASLVQAQDGAKLFASCAACHGKSGEGNDGVGAPAIGGQEVWYVERQLENFASARRGNHAADAFGKQMTAAVAVLKTASERAAVAAHVAKLSKVGAGGTAAKASAGKADLANGKTQFNALCSSCHGANAQGTAALQAPRLSGLSGAYIARQLANFKSGVRGSHPDDKPGKQMAAISKMLPDAKAERDVVAYVQTLKP